MSHPAYIYCSRSHRAIIGRALVFKSIGRCAEVDWMVIHTRRGYAVDIPAIWWIAATELLERSTMPRILRFHTSLLTTSSADAHC